ncbi:choice-of-anchor Q domain-containing protein [Thiocapsa roseopersicina]|uniref:Calx-beta domain-containing protein n=1 Tax=Thiocapsa roseopersicina TaxID=1058 RepID=A0A1H2U920_THIRO|nr:choice-of-anchor Q domain-containing protein [Thiocapsa roseopersicina]SDW52437.1 Calx-beta domain-containing protein [Thiocapsa roseopersicina]
MMQSPACPAQRAQAPEVAPAATPHQRFQLASRALALGSLLLLASGAPPAFAACGGVTTVSDEAQLNDAIAAFNADTTSDSCVFTIRLDADIALNESTTPIRNVISGKSMIIEGDGHQVDGQDGVNVQGFDGMQPFAIESGTVVTMNDLTVTRGKPVGDGALKRGGGIRNEGTLTLNRCTIAGNSVDRRGGGIANRGTLVIDSSTISGNVAGTTTGGSALGGGIYSEGGSVTITNSTISGNDADSGGLQDWGGGIFATGSLTLDSVTITDNFSTEGRGIYVDTVDGVLTIGNTILSGNVADADCYFDASGTGSVQDQGHNLFVDSEGCGFVDGVNNNILSRPFLEDLADNGGPTQTHAPQLLVSPAIDAGSTGLTVDQRGAARPSGAAADIGAYESQEGCGDAPWSVTNQVELSAAIECFNGKIDPGVYTISIDHGISATASTAPIDNATAGVELVIEGNGNSGDWNGSLFPGVDVRPFLIQAGTTVTINDFSITGGKVEGTERGGGIRNLGNLTINRCTITGNRSELNGGGINNAPGAVMEINDSTISGNQLVGDDSGETGGGIENEGSLTIKNSTISGNTSSNDGGGIATSRALVLDSVTVTGNSVSGAGAAGAGVYVGGFGTLTARNSILAGNSGAEDCTSFISPATDAGHNLVQTQYSCGFTNGVNGTIVGQNPLLGVLRNNGGPTRTHALLSGSPAIDAGATALTTDQRGYARPSGAADDIGAFEEAQVGSITIVKETPVESTTDYNFTLDGGQLVSPIDFPLDTSQNDDDGVYFSATFDLEAGHYSLTEEVLDDQELGPVAIACEDNAGSLGNFTGPTADISLGVYQDIRCTFTNDSIYWVSAVAVGSGSVSCSPVFVGQGESSTCTAVPASGFQVREWSGACAGVGSSTECVLSEIREDQTSTVVFESLPVESVLSVGDITVDEEAGNAVFTATLSPAPSAPVTVSYATADGSAQAGLDYRAASGTLSFAAGQTQQTITVPILEDSLVEGTESFTLALGAAGINSASATGRISDNDSGGAGPTCGVPAMDRTNDRGVFLYYDCADPRQWHLRMYAGGSASQLLYKGKLTASAAFASTRGVALEPPWDVLDTSVAARIAYQLKVDGKGIDGIDFRLAAGSTVCFAPSTLTELPVWVGADREVVITPIELTTLGACGDTPPPTPVLSVGDITVEEGAGNAVFTATLSPAPSAPVTVSYATADGSAQAGLDYRATSGTLSFAAGQTQQTITVPILEDSLVEGTESFTLALGAAGINSASATGRISDNDSGGAGPTCGVPAMDRTNDRGVFLYYDCADPRQWHLRMYAGGSASQLLYKGKLTASAAFASTRGVALELPWDVLDTSVAARIAYQLKVAGKGIDGIDFRLAAGSTVCFAPSTLTELPVWVGAERISATTPVNPVTLGSCSP